MTLPPDNHPSPHPSPEVIREFNDRGTLWLLEDPRNLQDLLRMVAPDLAARLDISTARRINRSFVPADLQKQESDLIFQVRFQSAAEAEARAVWIYVLLEHQSRPDTWLPLRLLEYMVELWSAQRREWTDQRVPAAAQRLYPIVPLVFYTGERGWSAPLQLTDLMESVPELERFIPRWETMRLNLHDTPAETLEEVATAVGWALRVLRAERAPLPVLEATLREALAGLETLTEEQRGQWVRITWYLVLLAFHRRERPEYDRLAAIVREQAEQSQFRIRAEVTEMGETMAQFVERRGETRGVARGEALGVRRSLEKVLARRFQLPPRRLAGILSNASLEQLNDWFDRALIARTLAEVGLPAPDRRTVRVAHPRRPGSH